MASDMKSQWCGRDCCITKDSYLRSKHSLYEACKRRKCDHVEQQSQLFGERRHETER